MHPTNTRQNPIASELVDLAIETCRTAFAIPKPAVTPADLRQLLILDGRKRYLLGTIDEGRALAFLRDTAKLTLDEARDQVNAWDEVLVTARSYERMQIECGSDRLSEGDRSRLDALWQGARPQLWAIDRVLTEQAAATPAQAAG